MALLTDDCDIDTVHLRTMLGGNGDYYIQLFLLNKISGAVEGIGTRISTSGGNAPSEVKIAVAELYKAMEKYGLNEHPY